LLRRRHNAGERARQLIRYVRGADSELSIPEQFRSADADVAGKPDGERRAVAHFTATGVYAALRAGAEAQSFALDRGRTINFGCRDRRRNLSHQKYFATACHQHKQYEWHKRHNARSLAFIFALDNHHYSIVLFLGDH
jgi:hypothetical protein